MVARRAGDEVVVDVSLLAEVELGVTVASQAGPVRLVGLSNTGGSSSDVTTDGGWVALRMHGPGTASQRIEAAQAGEPLRLQISLDGVPVEERWIEP